MGVRNHYRLDSRMPGRALRILVAQNVLHNRNGGMSRMLGFLHDRVQEDGHTVEYFTADAVPARFNRRMARFSFPWLLWRHVVRAAKAGRPYDVVNVHEPSGAFLALGKKAAGQPFLAVTSHGVEDRSWVVALDDARLGRVDLSTRTRLWHPLTLLTQARTTLRGADHIFCLNEEDRAFLKARYPLPAARITRLFPAAATAYLQAFQRRDYSKAERVLVFGTWLPRKGAADIVSAFEMLADHRPELKLLLMGTGFAPESVAQWFPLRLRSRLEFVEGGSEAELAAHMLTAAVYWIPSLFEGTPQTLMEAMATGLPAVGAATCGMKDVIKSGGNGILVGIRDSPGLAAATDRLLTNRVLRQQLGAQAHADVAQHYTWDRVAQPLLDVYRALARQRYACAF
jgi:glycosyltransferase involved in cell wall biosynthesis